MGCDLDVEHDEKDIQSVTGNQCARGAHYAVEEVFHPKRVVTTTVAVIGADIELLPVKTDRPVPKASTFDVVKLASTITATAPTQRGETLAENVLDTGVNLVATRSLPKTA